ncbi:hypothetical protein ACJMK2_028209 [Sinanodonta woodiana]|uniref:Uncharacterized protein n=1 Tax=Sinanodonta woodiana TaxID=1069815 RepID=A0ABD3X6X6_SINWO
MEAVRAFNNELSSLYDVKPPISRAKMAHVTKCAIKAIKFYKHVVQSVEKFVQKCKPEYKVPGLYVVDSIVRQSRHQFGPEKDVFAPRFTKNITSTFQNLLKCPPDDKSKIVRVLNLWQKNGVFPSEILQPLLDLAADPNNPDLVGNVQLAVDKVMGSSQKSSGQLSGDDMGENKMGEMESNQVSADNVLATQSDMLNTVNQLLRQTESGPTTLSQQQQQLQQLQLLQQQLIQQTQMMQNQPSNIQQSTPMIDSNLLAQIQALTNQLLSKTEAAKPPEPGGFNTKLLDFDYGESDDEDDRRKDSSQAGLAGNVQTILNDVTLMQQIHQMSQTLQKTEQLKTELSVQEQMRQQQLLQQQAEFDQQIGQGPPPPQPYQSAPQPIMPPYQPDQQHGGMDMYQQRQEPPPTSMDMQDEDFRMERMERDREREKKDRRSHRSKDRSRSRSRSPKRRKRSRSRSRDKRRRSKSRDRHRRSRSRDRERERQREKERERKKNCLPPLRENYLTVCSTTIWLGHVAKVTTEEEMKEVLEKYGTVESINMIPPRGCAFVCMRNRKEAAKAVDRLKGVKINGSSLKTAYAPGIGIKESEFKDLWEVDLGATYISWDSLPEDLSPFLEGGIIDEDSLPEHLKGTKTKKDYPDNVGEESQDGTGSEISQQQQQQPPMPQMNLQSQNPPLPGQMPPLPMSGLMPPGLPPPQPPGLVPPQGTMMQMTRGMTAMSMPQQIALPPGAPPPLPGAPPTMLGAAGIAMQRPMIQTIRPPEGIVTSLVTSSALTGVAASPLSQNIANIMSGTSALISQPPPGIMRPGFPPQSGFPHFSIPPPGFRMPPPGFNSAQRPPLNTQTRQTDSTGNMPSTGGWQAPTAWPGEVPDDDDEEDNEQGKAQDNASANSATAPPPVQMGAAPGFGMFGPQGNHLGSQGNNQGPPMMQGGPRPRGPFPGPMGLIGPPDGQSMGNMPPMMGGPRGPFPPPRLVGPPDRFNMPPGGPPMGPGGPRGRFFGPGGPRFMGNRPGMPGPPGFQRFPQGPPEPRGPPRPLLDIETKPVGNLEILNEEAKEEGAEDRFGDGDDRSRRRDRKEDKEEDWDQTDDGGWGEVARWNREVEERDDRDNSRDARFRGRDRYDRDRDDFNRHDRRFDRNKRGRDWDVDREGRGDWDRRDRDLNRDRDRRDREKERDSRHSDRDRSSRPSRWSDNTDVPNDGADETANDAVVTESNDVSNPGHSKDVQPALQEENKSGDIIPTPNQNGGDKDSVLQSNGPTPTVEDISVNPSKLESLKQTASSNEIKDNTENQEAADLEEGEIAS